MIGGRSFDLNPRTKEAPRTKDNFAISLENDRRRFRSYQTRAFLEIVHF